MKKTTRWFPMSINPAYRGWYQLDYGYSGSEAEYALSLFSIPDYWDGEKWLMNCGGERSNYKISPEGNWCWRGLTEQAKDQK